MMNLLLLLFAIPFAVIVVSIALQKLLRCPFLVAAIILSIFLVIGFAINDTTYLIAGIVYTVISFVTAYLTMLISRCLKNNNNNSLISNISNNSYVASTTSGTNDNGYTTFANSYYANTNAGVQASNNINYANTNAGLPTFTNSNFNNGYNCGCNRR